VVVKMAVREAVISLLSKVGISSQRRRVNLKAANNRLLSSKLHRAWTVLTMTYRSEEYINKNCRLKILRACFYKPFFIFFKINSNKQK
jgi:hypothetical protein